MDILKLKREEFTLQFRQQQRLKIFQEKRERLIQSVMEENQKKEIQIKITVGIEQLNTILNDFDCDSLNSELMYHTQNVIKLIEEMKEYINQINGPNLIGLGEKSFGYNQLLLFNKNNENILKLMNFFGFCCEKSIAFCDFYCKSTIYQALFTFSQQWNEQYQIEFLKHLFIVQRNREHRLEYSQLCLIIQEKVQKIQQHNKIQNDDQQIIQMIIEIFLEFKVEQIEKLKLMQEINKYFIAIILQYNNQYNLVIGNELMNYLDFLQKNRSYFDSTTIELINQLSFNPLLIKYSDEKSMAIAIIGLFMSGNLAQSKFYFFKFSDPNISLDQKLLQNLYNLSPQVRKFTVFTLSNIFGETQYGNVDYFENKTALLFIQYSKLERELEVYLEILQALRNLICSAETKRLPIFITEQVVQIITEYDNQEFSQYQTECLLLLISRFSEGDILQWMQTQIGFTDFLQYLAYNGILQFIQNMFQKTKEPSQELQRLCNLLM